MRIKSIEQLYNFCEDIFISNSNIDIVKFKDLKRTAIHMKVHNLTRLSDDLYLMKVLESAFKEYNVLEITLGSSFDKFTIILHMDLCY